MGGKLDLANMMQQAAERHGDRVFVSFENPLQYRMFEGDSITFNQGVRVVDTLANGLHDKLGVRKGDRVALVLTNVPEFAFLCAAAAKLGAVSVPFNYMLKADELSYAIEDCQAKVLVTERELFEANIQDKARLPGIESWIQLGPKEKVGEGFVSVDDLTEGCRDRREAAAMSPDDTAGIFYTSGTTGKPKGAMLSGPQPGHTHPPRRAHAAHRAQGHVRGGAAPGPHLRLRDPVDGRGGQRGLRVFHALLRPGEDPRRTWRSTGPPCSSGSPPCTTSCWPAA